MRKPLNFWLMAVALVCAASVWFGREAILNEDPEADIRQRGHANPGTWDSGADHAQLLVLNGTTQLGLARQISLLLGRVGLVPLGVGNAPPQEYPKSFLVNRRLPEARARSLARHLGGIPLIQEWDGRSTEDAVLVLGDDFQRLEDHLLAYRSPGEM